MPLRYEFLAHSLLLSEEFKEQEPRWIRLNEAPERRINWQVLWQALIEEKDFVFANRHFDCSPNLISDLS
jgi:hypothetical protein